MFHQRVQKDRLFLIFLDYIGHAVFYLCERELFESFGEIRQVRVLRRGSWNKEVLEVNAHVFNVCNQNFLFLHKKVGVLGDFSYICCSLGVEVLD